jgi:hypothetical protein
MRLNSGAQPWRFATVLVALVVLAGPVGAEEAEGVANESRSSEETGCVALCSDPDATAVDKAFDAVVLRPFAAGQALLGIGAFAVAVPLTWATGRMDEAWDIFVQVPYDDAFIRKLGDF